MGEPSGYLLSLFSTAAALIFGLPHLLGELRDGTGEIFYLFFVGGVVRAKLLHDEGLLLPSALLTLP